MSYYESKKRKALSGAINCMLGAAVLAGGMFGNTGIVSSAEHTAMYKGGEWEGNESYHQNAGADKIVIKAYDDADPDFNYCDSTSKFYGKHIIGSSWYGANGKIFMYGGIVTNIYGAWNETQNGDVYDNIVDISGGKVICEVVGGYANYGAAAVSSGSASKNIVTISNAEIGTDAIGGYVYDVYNNGTGDAKENKVSISGSSVVNRDVYGGYVNNAGNAHDNTVKIEKSTVNGNVYGGYGCSNSKNVYDNTVYIYNSTIKNDVYGGKGDYMNAGKVENNTVIIGGGSILKDGARNCNVYANYTDIVNGGTTGAGTVILYGATMGSLYGSLNSSPSSDSAVLSKDNTLNVCSLNNTVDRLQNFDTINFYVPKEAKDKDTMLTITGSPGAEGHEKTDFNNVKTIRAGVVTGSGLKKDNIINLLTNKNGLDNVSEVIMNTTDTVDGVTAEIIGTGLAKIDGTVKVSEDGNSIILQMNEDAELSEDSKSLVETRAGGMALLNNGADMAVGKGFMSAQAAAEADGNSNGASAGGYTTYAAIGGADMRYETGSYVDSKGWGINVGLSRIVNYQKSKLTLAPFIEYGKASYDSYLDNGTHGDGYNSFTGIGFMAKNEQKDGLYYEGSVRIGRAKGDYQGDANTYDSKYDTASNYLAFHAGIGKVQKLSEKNSLDYYGKLFYTHQNGDTVNISSALGDAQYEFDAINSYRTRLGARWTSKLNKTDSFYAGIAWDYEFDSEARAHYNGMSTPAPSMKGSSGMLELGWKQEATKDNPFGVDLGLTGWCGKQRGVSFNAGFSWEF